MWHWALVYKAIFIKLELFCCRILAAILWLATTYLFLNSIFFRTCLNKINKKKMRCFTSWSYLLCNWRFSFSVSTFCKSVWKALKKVKRWFTSFQRVARNTTSHKHKKQKKRKQTPTLDTKDHNWVIHPVLLSVKAKINSLSYFTRAKLFLTLHWLVMHLNLFLK